MNRIIYYGASGQTTFFHGNAAANGTDGLIMSGSVEQRLSLFGSELPEGTMTFRVHSNALTESTTGFSPLYTVNMEPVKTQGGDYYVIETGSVDWRNFRYGAKVLLYTKPTGSVITAFYVIDVKQVSRKTLEFTCTDGIGMLARMGDHNGGLYTGQTFRSVLNDIFAGSNISYSCDSEVGQLPVRGRLPRANRRRNLADLLLATGVSVVQNGRSMLFRFLGESISLQLPNIYLNGNDISYGNELATEVQVTEHSFYALASDEQVTLFDNTDETVALDNQLVVFNEPVHDLTTTGTLVINESNINYAVVSGVGTLVGKEYTHNTRVVTRATGLTGEKNVKSLEQNQLVGLHNSANVSRRMAAYYSTPISATVEANDTTGGAIIPGLNVSFTDAFGTVRKGWVCGRSFEIGNKARAHFDILVDWTPGPYGDSYSAYKVFRESDISNGRITFPAAMVGANALIMLFGGAGGGQGGYDGENGDEPSGTEANYGKLAMGGPGGEPGYPGERGMVFSVQVESLPAYYDGAAIGVGGAGGARNGEPGKPGTATTLGVWSSADGAQLPGEHINLIDGTVYGPEGQPGLPGGDGGDGKGAGEPGHQWYVPGPASNGTNVAGYTGGAHDDGNYFEDSHDRHYYTGGAGGGGAAYGNAGYAGTAGYDPNNWISVGGNGANAVAFGKAAETVPGRGGNGGGGGGSSAVGLLAQGPNETYGYNDPGIGGFGSAGGQGGDGLILVYYNPN